MKRGLQIIFIILFLFNYVYSKTLCLYFYGYLFSLSSINAYIHLFKKENDYKNFSEVKIIFVEDLKKEDYYTHYSETLNKINALLNRCDENIIFDEELSSFFKIQRNNTHIITKTNLCPVIKDLFSTLKFNSIYVLYDGNTVISEISKQELAKCLPDNLNIEFKKFETTSDLDSFLFYNKFSSTDVIINLIYQLKKTYGYENEILIQKLISYKVGDALVVSNRYLMIQYGADIVYDIDYNSIYKVVKSCLKTKCSKIDKMYRLFYNAQSTKPLLKYILKNIRNMERVF